MLPYFLCSAPFTVQRLCELILQPKKHYKKLDFYLRAVEKVRPSFPLFPTHTIECTAIDISNTCQLHLSTESIGGRHARTGSGLDEESKVPAVITVQCPTTSPYTLLMSYYISIYITNVLLDLHTLLMSYYISVSTD